MLALDDETSRIVRAAVESGEYSGDGEPPAQLETVAEYGSGVWGSDRYTLPLEATESGFAFRTEPL